MLLYRDGANGTKLAFCVICVISATRRSRRCSAHRIHSQTDASIFFPPPRRQSSSRAVMLCARRKQKVREGGNSAVARSLLTAIKRRPPRTTDVIQAEAAGAALAAAPVDESRKGKASDRAVAGYGWTPSICDISRTARESW